MHEVYLENLLQKILKETGELYDSQGRDMVSIYLNICTEVSEASLKLDIWETLFSVRFNQILITLERLVCMRS